MPDKRLIDANALMKNIGKIPQLRGITYGRMKKAVEETPTIDAVPVVRCRECKYARPLVQEEWVECIMWFRGSLVDGFCHMGAMMDAQDMDVHAKDGGAE